ncbi:hypothetical protein QVD17_30665 [Tagetes erecta]|uniref:Uncharacterized protein n=1 Tax=Tagetes erecta TaxID=13708 RepID=A0AAD8NNL4_TARER|nr:hypothetical protein QVD17_30665 [Tagetes erecta]
MAPADNMVAVETHTHVLQQGHLIGKAADVFASANTTVEVALRLVKSGKVNQGCYFGRLIQQVVRYGLQRRHI